MRRHSIRLIILAAFLGGAVALDVGQSAASRPSPAPAGPQARAASSTVRIGDNFFRPQHLTVARGATVTWRWTGTNMHNVTFTQLGKHSRTQTRGSYHLRFTRPGTYHYLCTIHGFTGTVRVR